MCLVGGADSAGLWVAHKAEYRPLGPVLILCRIETRRGYTVLATDARWQELFHFLVEWANLHLLLLQSQLFTPRPPALSKFGKEPVSDSGARCLVVVDVDDKVRCPDDYGIRVVMGCVYNSIANIQTVIETCRELGR